MNLYEQIRQIIAKELALEKEKIVPEAHLQDDLGADSLALLNLAEALQLRFGVPMESDDLVDLANVGEVVQLVESKIAARPV